MSDGIILSLLGPHWMVARTVGLWWAVAFGEWGDGCCGFMMAVDRAEVGVVGVCVWGGLWRSGSRGGRWDGMGVVVCVWGALAFRVQGRPVGWG